MLIWFGFLYIIRGIKPLNQSTMKALKNFSLTSLTDKHVLISAVFSSPNFVTYPYFGTVTVSEPA